LVWPRGQVHQFGKQALRHRLAWRVVIVKTQRFQRDGILPIPSVLSVIDDVAGKGEATLAHLQETSI
jgi:hypothetical protein